MFGRLGGTWLREAVASEVFAAAMRSPATGLCGWLKILELPRWYLSARAAIESYQKPFARQLDPGILQPLKRPKRGSLILAGRATDQTKSRLATVTVAPTLRSSSLATSSLQMVGDHFPYWY